VLFASCANVRDWDFFRTFRLSLTSADFLNSPHYFRRIVTSAALVADTYNQAFDYHESAFMLKCLAVDSPFAYETVAMFASIFE